MRSCWNEYVNPLLNSSSRVGEQPRLRTQAEGIATSTNAWLANRRANPTNTWRSARIPPMSAHDTRRIAATSCWATRALPTSLHFGHRHSGRGSLRLQKTSLRVAMQCFFIDGLGLEGPRSGCFSENFCKVVRSRYIVWEVEREGSDFVSKHCFHSGSGVQGPGFRVLRDRD